MARTFDLNEYVLKVLRKEYYYKWPERNRALQQALRPYGQYECAKCNQWVKSEDEIEVDHIEPVVPVTGERDLNTTIPRLLVSYTSLQILCLPCHKAKSKSENAERRKNRKK